MSKDMRDKALGFIGKNAPVLLVLLLGCALMLLPGSCRADGEAAEQQALFEDDEQRLSAVLSRVEGVGEAAVLLRCGEEEEYLGAVVVCQGAESAQVRLRVTKTVAAFTGLGNDRIIVMKSTKQGGQ